MAQTEFEIGTRVRVSAGPYRGREGEIFARRTVPATGAAAAMADDASTRVSSCHYEIRFANGEIVTLGQSLLSPLSRERAASH